MGISNEVARTKTCPLDKRPCTGSSCMWGVYDRVVTSYGRMLGFYGNIRKVPEFTNSTTHGGCKANAH